MWAGDRCFTQSTRSSCHWHPTCSASCASRTRLSYYLVSQVSGTSCCVHSTPSALPQALQSRLTAIDFFLSNWRHILASPALVSSPHPPGLALCTSRRGAAGIFHHTYRMPYLLQHADVYLASNRATIKPDRSCYTITIKHFAIFNKCSIPGKRCPTCAKKHRHSHRREYSVLQPKAAAFRFCFWLNVIYVCACCLDNVESCYFCDDIVCL